MSARILVAVQDPDLRAAVRHTLASHLHGDEVHEVPSDDVLTESLHRGPVDLLVADDAAQLERARTVRPGIPTILLGDWTRTPLSRLGGDAKGAWALQEPFSAAALLADARDALAPQPKILGHGKGFREVHPVAQ